MVCTYNKYVCQDRLAIALSALHLISGSAVLLLRLLLLLLPAAAVPGV